MRGRSGRRDDEEDGRELAAELDDVREAVGLRGVDGDDAASASPSESDPNSMGCSSPLSSDREHMASINSQTRQYIQFKFTGIYHSFCRMRRHMKPLDSGVGVAFGVRPELHWLLII